MTIVGDLFTVGWLMVPGVSLMIDHFDLFGTRQVWLHLRGLEYTPPAFRVRMLYKYVRHPLYIGWALSFWATPTMSLGHLLFAASLTLYMALAARVEEKDLVKYLGWQYEAYRRRVPMFIPRLRRGVSVKDALPLGLQPAEASTPRFSSRDAVAAAPRRS